MCTRTIFPGIIAATLCVVASAHAQTKNEYQQRQSDLVTLGAIFGDLHNIRRNCEPRMEADAWRNRMLRVVELEQPTDTQYKAIATAFNVAYRKSLKQYPRCDRRAEDYAARRASEGQAIVNRLMAPLKDAVAQDENGTQVWRGRNHASSNTTELNDGR